MVKRKCIFVDVKIKSIYLPMELFMLSYALSSLYECQTRQIDVTYPLDTNKHLIVRLYIDENARALVRELFENGELRRWKNDYSVSESQAVG